MAVFVMLQHSRIISVNQIQDYRGDYILSRIVENNMNKNDSDSLT